MKMFLVGPLVWRAMISYITTHCNFPQHTNFQLWQQMGPRCLSFQCCSKHQSHSTSRIASVEFKAQRVTLRNHVKPSQPVGSHYHLCTSSQARDLHGFIRRIPAATVSSSDPCNRTTPTPLVCVFQAQGNVPDPHQSLCTSKISGRASFVSQVLYGTPSLL